MEITLGMERWESMAIAFGAALGGGAINALAGGGTILTFPALIGLGIPPVIANATSALALWPSGVGGSWGFRREIAEAERWWLWLVVPSVAGGALGAILLLSLPSEFFALIAPYLVLVATLLMALERPVEKLLPIHPGRKASTAEHITAIVVQFAVATYGGYFGASLGILVLTALTLVGVRDIGQANGLKNLFSLAIKGVAVAYFIAIGAVVWGYAILMVVGAIVGGYAGGELGHRVEERVLRLIIVLIGVGMAITLFVGLS